MLGQERQAEARAAYTAQLLWRLGADLVPGWADTVPDYTAAFLSGKQMEHSDGRTAAKRLAARLEAEGAEK